jgi:hypothetical protein
VDVSILPNHVNTGVLFYFYFLFKYSLGMVLTNLLREFRTRNIKALAGMPTIAVTCARMPTIAVS